MCKLHDWNLVPFIMQETCFVLNFYKRPAIASRGELLFKLLLPNAIFHVLCSLVCSDSMARGMDVKGVSHVILYDAPSLVKTYIHRIGRTARAGETGTAYTLLKHEEVRL